MKLYEIDNLTFAYPDIASERDDVYLKPVLKDIGLSIEKGSFVIVAGGSGSGNRVYPLVFLICYNAYLKFFSTITLMSSGLP